MRHCFSVFESDDESGILSRSGTDVPLQAQPARVLACLVQHPGVVLSRETLNARIWGDQTFVDFERGLNFSISQLRHALRDDSARPIFIKTHPKRGCEFIAPVRLLEDFPMPVGSRNEPQLKSDKEVPIPDYRRWNWRTPWMLLCFSVAFCLLFAWNSSAKRLPIIVAVARFDNETGVPDAERFTENLTQDVVAHLSDSGAGHFEVVGNSQILRTPSEARNLLDISRQLHAQYVVLGQTQSDGKSTRVLVHLIRLPSQTHVWVVRADDLPALSGVVESKIATEVAGQFAPRIIAGKQ